MPRNFGFVIKQDELIRTFTHTSDEYIEMGFLIKSLWKYLNAHQLKILRKDL